MIHNGPTNGKAAVRIDAALAEAYPDQAFELWPRRAVNAEYIVTVEWLNGPLSADVERLCYSAVGNANNGLNFPTRLVFRQVSRPEHMTIH